MNQSAQPGFIALMSAIIISSVLILMMVSTSTSSFFARADSSRSEYKRISLGLAESCTNAAILKTVQNFTYDLTTDLDYGPIPHNLLENGVRVAVGPDECYITGLVLDAVEDVNHRKKAKATVQAEYNGAFSNIVTDFTVQNPDRGVSVTPPTCALVAAPTSLPTNKPLTLAWSSSPNASTITVQGGSLTTPVTLSPTLSGTYAIPNVAPSPGTITYTATVSNAGGSSQCTATVTVISPPPTPACADVVMVLDRSGSMFGDNPPNYDNHPEWIADLQNAAREFLNKYLDPSLNLNPLPFVGVARFGDSGGQSADIIAQLTNVANYASPFFAINNGLPHYLPAGVQSATNLADAITVSDKELNGIRHVSGHKKGILMISDGAPNRPSGNAVAAATAAATLAKQGTGAAYKHADGIETQIFTVHFGSAGPSGTHTDQDYLATLATNSLNDNFTGGSGFKFPTANAQNASGDEWSTPEGAYGASYAGDSAGHRHRYSTFGFGVPTGSAINGIEVKVNGWSTVDAINGTLFSDSFGTGGSSADISGWEEEGSDNDATTQAQQSGSGNDTASPNGSRFAKIGTGEWICRNVNGSAWQSMSLSYYWRGDTQAEVADKGIVEYNTNGGDCTTNTGWTALNTYDLNTNTAGWTGLQTVNLPTALNNDGSFLIRFRSTANSADEDFRVDGVTLAGTQNVACTLGIDLSWNGGTSWSTEKTQLLTNVAQNYTFGGATDDWSGSHTWNAGELSDANFRLRIRELAAGPTCIVDSLEAKIHYPSVADAVAENSDGDHFFITPNSSDMTNVFTTIGGLLCPAAAPACSNTVDDDGDGFTDATDPDCANPSDNDEWAPPALPTPPVPPATPPNINIGSWQEKPVLTFP